MTQFIEHTLKVRNGLLYKSTW